MIHTFPERKKKKKEKEKTTKKSVEIIFRSI